MSLWRIDRASGERRGEGSELGRCRKTGLAVRPVFRHPPLIKVLRSAGAAAIVQGRPFDLPQPPGTRDRRAIRSRRRGRAQGYARLRAVRCRATCDGRFRGAAAAGSGHAARESRLWRQSQAGSATRARSAPASALSRARAAAQLRFQLEILEMVRQQRIRAEAFRARLPNLPRRSQNV